MQCNQMQSNAMKRMKCNQLKGGDGGASLESFAAVLSPSASICSLACNQMQPNALKCNQLNGGDGGANDRTPDSGDDTVGAAAVVVRLDAGAQRFWRSRFVCGDGSVGRLRWRYCCSSCWNDDDVGQNMVDFQFFLQPLKIK